MPFYAVRVTGGKEDIAAELVASEAKKQKLEIYSVMAPPGLKGYIIVEALNYLEVQRAIFGVRHTKMVIPQEIKPEEVLRYFQEEKPSEEFSVGNLVEILIGAFKGTRAKILKIDDKKKELTVELLDTPVPITITVPVNGVKLLKKEE